MVNVEKMVGTAAHLKIYGWKVATQGQRVEEEKGEREKMLEGTKKQNSSPKEEGKESRLTHPVRS